MCTILFSWKTVPGYDLILVGNRDEFYGRKTKNAYWWDEHPNILAGQDLQAGGTWMGVNKNGRFAAITNYRKFPLDKFETSRGDLVKNYLIGEGNPSDYLNFLQEKGQKYDGFNLLFGNPDEMYCFSNRGPEKKLEPSVYGLSNHLLDTPWPKVQNGKANFSEELKKFKIHRERLFGIMSNKDQSEDTLLPNTGIGIEKERLLSSIFIESPDYGTRLTTYISISKSGQVVFHEKSFVPKNEQVFEFKIG